MQRRHYTEEEKNTVMSQYAMCGGEKLTYFMIFLIFLLSSSISYEPRLQIFPNKIEPCFRMILTEKAAM